MYLKWHGGQTLYKSQIFNSTFSKGLETQSNFSILMGGTFLEKTHLISSSPATLIRYLFQVEAAFARFDRNGDDRLNYREFCHMIHMRQQLICHKMFMQCNIYPKTNIFNFLQEYFFMYNEMRCYVFNNRSICGGMGIKELQFQNSRRMPILPAKNLH